MDFVALLYQVDRRLEIEIRRLAKCSFCICTHKGQGSTRGQATRDVELRFRRLGLRDRPLRLAIIFLCYGQSLGQVYYIKMFTIA